MRAHTTGPYHIKYGTLSDGTRRVESILSDAGDLICEGLNWNANGEVDGHLLAASCELLAMLKDIREWGGFSDLSKMKECDVLIAKAEGADQ